MLLANSALYKILYNPGENIKILLNGTVKHFKKGSALFCKPLNDVQLLNNAHEVKVMAFNKDFYPLASEEDEINFYWFWYFGVEHPQFIDLNDSEVRFIETLLKSSEEKFSFKSSKFYDSQQLIIKRMIRAFSLTIQNSSNKAVLSPLQLSSIKRFNGIIETHFKTKNTISDYLALIKQPSSALLATWKKNLVGPVRQIFNGSLILRLKTALGLGEKGFAKEPMAIDYLEDYYLTSFSADH